jgi:replicative DNA helicase
MANDNLPGKVPPQNIEAEQSLLGSILLKSSSMDTIIPIIHTNDFYDPKHKKIFGAMLKLNEESSAIDILTVIEYLLSNNKIESVGGASYISSLPDIVPTSAHIEDYANIVREKSDLRKLIDMSSEVLESAYRQNVESLEIIEGAENRIFGITDKNQSTMVMVRDTVSDVYEKIDKMGKNPDAYVGLETGFKRIDEATSGLQSGELVIVAARPAVGKTSLVLNIAHKLATKKDKNVLIFSFEMSSEDLIRRLLAIGSRVNIKKIRTGKFVTREEKQLLMEAAGKLSGTSICIDTDDNSVFEMRAKARTLMAQLKRESKKLDLIIIDYIQLVKPDASIKVSEQQISNISRTLKTLARESGVPVIALSQLNREVEKRDRTPGKSGESKKIPPKLSDLRESGAIEQDADVVMFIDKENDELVDASVSYQDGEKVMRKMRKCKLIIAKNRNGPTDEQKVWFIPDLTAFEERSESETDEIDPAAFNAI